MLIDDLIQARKWRNMTQADLAEATGMTQSVIARIESKKVDPRLSTLQKLTEALQAELLVNPLDNEQ